MATKILKGPGGISLELDTAQVDLENPGNGTPALVYNAKRTANATYWCAQMTGELLLFHGIQDESYPLSAAQMEWLESQEDVVDAFLYPEGSPNA